jgi:hypothetical protein
MVKTRYIKAKLFDFTADGCVIIDGMEGEHLIVECGFAQIVNLDRCLDKYIEHYKPKEETAA